MEVGTKVGYVVSVSPKGLTFYITREPQEKTVYFTFDLHSSIQ